MNLARMAEVRRQIADGVYPTPAQIDVAVERVRAELAAEKVRRKLAAMNPPMRALPSGAQRAAALDATTSSAPRPAHERAAQPNTEGLPLLILGPGGEYVREVWPGDID